jgi:sec-independent protein translocase protein TatA
MRVLLFLEFIGTTELLVVLLVALVVFGPRKLPELGRTLGRTLKQLQAASDDFKRTWETESREVSSSRLPPPTADTEAREELQKCLTP